MFPYDIGLLFFVNSSRSNHRELETTKGQRKESEIVLFLFSNSLRYHRGYRVNFKAISKPISPLPFTNILSPPFSTFGTVLSNGLLLVGFNRRIYTSGQKINGLKPCLLSHNSTHDPGPKVALLVQMNMFYVVVIYETK